jgi:hypothetical protein
MHGCAGPACTVWRSPVQRFVLCLWHLFRGCNLLMAAVLGVSLLLEGASLLVAIRSVREGAEIAGLSFMEYVRRGIDPTSVAVMMEDAGACAGLIVAGQLDPLLHEHDCQADLVSIVTASR